MVQTSSTPKLYLESLLVDYWGHMGIHLANIFHLFVFLIECDWLKIFQNFFGLSFSMLDARFESQMPLRNTPL